MAKEYWVIRTPEREVLKKDGKLLFFITPDDAHNYITICCGDSPYLDVSKWNRAGKSDENEK